MRYWDSSALVPLLVEERTSDRMKTLVSEDPAIVTWLGSRVECVSALTRAERDGRLSGAGLTEALARLRRGAEQWLEVPASAALREEAIRALRLHPLLVVDALHLAAALVAAGGQPGSLEFVTLDERLAEAAEREGFRVLS